MDFPLLRTFEVSDSFTSFLNEKFDQYKKENSSYDEVKNSFDEKNGYQTMNLVNWGDEEFGKFVDERLAELISSQLGIDRSGVSYHWIHFLDYEKGGSMGYHNHIHNEDFVLFIYLKDCNSGSTVFHLNNFKQEYTDRTQIEILPKKNHAALFSAYLMHKGKHTKENKRIFVVGIRVSV